MRHSLHSDVCIPNADQAFRLIETTHSGRSRPACGRVYGPRRMIRESAANATSEITYAQNRRHASAVCCWLAPIAVGANCTALRAACKNQISVLSHAADAERVVDIRNDTLIKIEHEQCQDMSRPRRPLARMLSDSDLIFKSLEFPG